MFAIPDNGIATNATPQFCNKNCEHENDSIDNIYAMIYCGVSLERRNKDISTKHLSAKN